MVDFIINPNKISVKAIDDLTGQVYGTFTLENTSVGILIVATALPDYNNVTNGNHQSIFLNGIFVNPSPGPLVFTSVIDSEPIPGAPLGFTDTLISSTLIECIDCYGDTSGTAFIDSCGNCVGGNTGAVACINFSPSVTVQLSNTDCDSLSDLTISVSQDPNEPDMSTSLFTSNLNI